MHSDAFACIRFMESFRFCARNSKSSSSIAHSGTAQLLDAASEVVVAEESAQESETYEVFAEAPEGAYPS